MDDKTSFLKAYCPRKNRYWGITLRKHGDEWVAHDFYPMDPSQAKVTVSQVRQDHFDVNPTMTPCVDGRGHRMQSSDRVPCPQSNKYSFQCIYCRQLQISYESDLTGTQFREGDVIRLAQGQEIRIERNGKALEEIELNVGWDPDQSARMDIDSSVIMIGREDDETVYFGRLEDSAHSVHHYGDNLTGAGSDDVDERIVVKLNDVPSDYERLAIIINIYDCQARRQTFASVRNMFIRLYDAKSHAMLCEYKVTHNVKSATGLVVGELNRSGSGWTFRASGESMVTPNIDYMADRLIDRFRRG